MYINEVKEALKYATQIGITPFLMGKQGIGKTQAVRQFGKENGYDSVIDLRLGTQDVGDLLGLQDIERNEQGEIVRCKFARPDWFPTSGKHVIFLDEINRAPRYVLQAVFQLVLDKRIHNHVLPSECVIVAAANPDTDDFSVTDMSDSAWTDRFCFIKVEENLEVFLDYAASKGMDGSFISFLGEQGNYLSGKSEDFDINNIVNPSPRTWLDFVDPLKKLNPPDKIFKELLQGMVGSSATLAYMTHLHDYEKKFNPEKILFDYKNFKPEFQKLLKGDVIRFDLINALNMDLVNKLDEKMAGFLEMDMEEIINTNTKYKVLNEKPLKNLCEYLLELPIESSVSLLNRIRDHENLLINSGLGNYLADNKKVLDKLIKQSEKADKLMGKEVKTKKEDNV